MAHKYRTIASFPSKSRPGKKYLVKQDETGALSCNCPLWIYKQWGRRDCPHIRIARTECRSVLKNPEPKWVCPSCGAVIWTPMPQAMLKCPVCGKKTKLGETKTNPKSAKSLLPFIPPNSRNRYRKCPNCGTDRVIKTFGSLGPKYKTIWVSLSDKDLVWFCPKCKKYSEYDNNPRQIPKNKATRLAKLSMKQHLTEIERREFQRLSLEVKPVEYKEALLRILPKNPVGLYEKFHGTNPRRLRKVQFRNPKPGEKVTKIGRLVELVYHPEPPSKRSGSQYVHSFGDYGFKFKNVQPILAVTKDGKQLLVINDKASPKFGSRGIVG